MQSDFREQGDLMRTWNEIDSKCVEEQRGLALDILQLAGSGHPGATLALMPVLNMLFSKFLIHDPRNPKFTNRDRLVLSCGHASLALYIQLYYSGYKISVNDLKEFRRLGSVTPGHPELNYEIGVETSTGPLGQGIATAVGMAISQKKQSLGWNSKKTTNKVIAIVSDGDLQEGISFEAASIASLYNLDNLIVIHDSNDVTIDGSIELSTQICMTEYFKAMGWKTARIETTKSGEVDIHSLMECLSQIGNEQKPKFIELKTIIGFPATESKGLPKIHGTLMSEQEVRSTKLFMNLDPDTKFKISDDLLNRFRIEVNKRIEKESVIKQIPKKVSDSSFNKILWAIDEIKIDPNASMRKANGLIIQTLNRKWPGTIGGSADLRESNSLKSDNAFSKFEDSMYSDIGLNVAYGVREHAMAAITNGLALDTENLAYCATYLAFADYQKPAIRLSAIMDLPAIYLWTHDSVAIGADGPTHQPIEQLSMLRSIPNFKTIRPSNAHELKIAWKRVLTEKKASGFVLSRQETHPNPESELLRVSDFSVSQGAYKYSQNFQEGIAQVLIISTGSEVNLAHRVSRSAILKTYKIQVVSMLCREWFEASSLDYQEKVIPTETEHIFTLEAASTFGWHRYASSPKHCFGINQFGFSGEGNEVLTHFGFTEEQLTKNILDVLLSERFQA